MMHFSPTVERIVDEADKFHIVKTQDVEPILRAIQELPDHMTKSVAASNQKFIGTVPNVMAVAWAREWGVRLYSREWLEKARKRLDDPDYSRLRLRY